MTPEESAARTRFLARIAGPYLVLAGLAMIVRMNTLELLVPAFMSNGPLVLVAGGFTLAMGLTALAGHHHTNTLVALVLTILAALTAIKGAVLLIFGPVIAPLYAVLVNNPVFAVLWGIVAILLGGWLAVVGWRRA
jgi:hypothetical protein